MRRGLRRPEGGAPGPIEAGGGRGRRPRVRRGLRRPEEGAPGLMEAGGGAEQVQRAGVLAAAARGRGARVRALIP